MKITYLVKKNPDQPTGDGNWIIMDSTRFLAFKQTEEGRKRSNNFIKLCTEYDDECIVMECDFEKLVKWKAELNRTAYAEKVNRETGYSTYSYQYLETDEDELNGEDTLVDESDSVEEIVFIKMESERLLKLMKQLSEEDQKLIYSFYFTTSPTTETAYAKANGLSQQLVHFRKERALKRLKNLYFS